MQTEFFFRAVIRFFFFLNEFRPYPFLKANSSFENKCYFFQKLIYIYFYIVFFFRLESLSVVIVVHLMPTLDPPRKQSQLLGVSLILWYPINHEFLARWALEFNGTDFDHNPVKLLHWIKIEAFEHWVLQQSTVLEGEKEVVCFI